MIINLKKIKEYIDTALDRKADKVHTHPQYLTDHQDISGKEDKTNKSNSISGDTGSTTKYPTIKAVEDYAQPKGNYSVTVTKLSNATTGYIATYEVKQGNVSLGKIDIPKDYLIKSGSVKSVTTANNPVNGYAMGDKYIDFIVNTKDSSGTDEHIYINVKDLIDTYEPVTVSSDGLMTAEDKIKLNGIAEEANKYVHPSGTAKTGNPDGNKTPGFGDTFTVTQFTSNNTGHISGATDRTVKIPNTEATTSKAGLMSANDKTKLNGVATGANNYSHPSTQQCTHTHNYIPSNADGTTTGNLTATTSGKGIITANQFKVNGKTSGNNIGVMKSDGTVDTSTYVKTSSDVGYIKNDGTIGTPAGTTYTAGTGLTLSGNQFGIDTEILSNGTNLNNVRTMGFYAQPTSSKTSNMTNLPDNTKTAFTMIVQAFTDGGVTQLLTFWSSNKTYVRTGSASSWNSWVELSKDTNTTYTAGTNLSLSGTKFEHATSGVGAKTTSALYKEKIDAQGHVTEATAVTIDNSPANNASNLVTSQGVYNGLAGKAPNSHAVNASTYGLGTTGVYGHTKVIQNLTTSDGNGLALGAGQGKELKTQIDNNRNEAQNITFFFRDLALYFDVPYYYRSYTNNEDITDLLKYSSAPKAELSVQSTGLKINSSQSSTEKQFYFPVVNPTYIKFTYVGGTLQGWMLKAPKASSSICYGSTVNSSWSISMGGSTTTLPSDTLTSGDIIEIQINPNGNLTVSRNGTAMVSKAVSTYFDGIPEYYFGFYTNYNRKLVIKYIKIQ